MTTNQIERLDPALIRPGRVDMKVELYLADEDQSQVWSWSCRRVEGFF
jgi:ATP-dependent 26S proteasome regulatory subunit